MNSNNIIRVVIVDDHQIIIDGLIALLQSHKNIQVAATARNGKEVLEKLRDTPCEVVITDIKMPEMNGIEATRMIKQKYPKVNVLVLSTYSDKQLISEMIKAGALGYILKDTGKKDLITAINFVAEGKHYYGSEVAMKIVNSEVYTEGEGQSIDVEELSLLTKREIEVLKLIAKEYTTSEIASELFISSHTVETHRKNLIRKLNAKSLAGLVKYAVQKGLIN